MLLEVFRWLDSKGGVAAIGQVNNRKARVLYDAIDGSDGYYRRRHGPDALDDERDLYLAER